MKNEKFYFRSAACEFQANCGTVSANRAHVQQAHGFPPAPFIPENCIYLPRPRYSDITLCNQVLWRNNKHMRAKFFINNG